jgi:hypothetical protein
MEAGGTVYAYIHSERADSYLKPFCTLFRFHMYMPTQSNHTYSTYICMLPHVTGVGFLSRCPAQNSETHLMNPIVFLFLFFKFSTPVGWFYFLLHITITIINCNSSTSDVGGCLLPRLSE